MIINEMPLPSQPVYDFRRIAPPERIIFFDIETTGLGAARANIYLIGAVFYEDGEWKLRQYFAEGMQDEQELLGGFFGLLAARKKLGRLFLISFNGDGFDIPFITKCIAQYGLPYDFSGTYSIDLFKKIKPYRRLMGLENCKLKTVERLCGIYREDRFSGGELIYVYEEYLRLSALDRDSCEYTDNNMALKDKLLKTLLLHNAEDIMDMPGIMDILGADELFNGGFDITESRICGDVWNINASLYAPLPKGIYFGDDDVVISISEEDKLLLNAAVTLCRGELKSFYADYKNYYYLPQEDYALHKSLGEFVDKKARRQATARTCYQRVEGLFVPEYEPLLVPMYYKEYKQLPAYGRLKEEHIDADGSIDHSLAREYVLSLLKELMQRQNAMRK